MTSDGPVIIAVGGGKGGVGKSVVATNVAVASSQAGMRTVLVDMDLGAANQHTLLGIDRPGSTVQSFLDRSVDTLEEVATPTGVARLFLIPGVGAIPGAANLAHSQKLKLLRHLRKVDCDVLVVDVGAGVSFNVLDFFALGDHRLVVTSPQLASMQNAYCFAKASVHRQLRARIENHAQREAFRAAQRHSETDRVSELRSRLRVEGAELDVAFDQVLRGFGGHLLGNMLESPAQRPVLTALSRMCRDFLDLPLPVSAALPMSRQIHESVSRRRPMLLSQPNHAASRSLRSFVETLLMADVAALRALRHQSRPVSIRASQAPPVGPGEAPLVGYLRSEERVEVCHAARVSSCDAPVPARVSDISLKGVQLTGDLVATEGDRLTIRLVGFPDRPSIHGVVRHVAVSGQSFGVQLDSESAEVAARLLDTETPRRTSTLPPSAARPSTMAKAV
ncbi:MAG: P-loop NTPase [Sandaracinaceae bacterium]